MKKKIDVLVDFYKETTEVNDLVKALNEKMPTLEEAIKTMTDEHWITLENVLKRKKVSLKSTFGFLYPKQYREKNFPISSLHITYTGEINKVEDGNNLGGIYLCLILRSRSGSHVDIGIACNDGCMSLPSIAFDKHVKVMNWEDCEIRFKNIEDLETVIDFCESALREVNEKLAAANLKGMQKIFHFH